MGDSVQFDTWELERMKGVAVLSTIGADGFPHSAPVGMRIEAGALWFETQEESTKLRNIDRDPRVCVLFFGQPKWGVLVHGQAEVMSRGDKDRQPQIRVTPTRKAAWKRKEG